MNDMKSDAASTRTTRERLIDMIRNILGQPQASRPLPIDARLAELGMSSIKMVNLMLAIEMEFNLTIPPSDITPDNFESIASVEAMLQKIFASTGGG
jgi:acyl carrier protein